MIRTARTLATSSVRQRGVVVAGLAFVERLLAPGLFLAYFYAGALAAAGVVASITVIATLRGMIQRTGAVKTEAELYQRAVAALLDGDVLRASPLPDAEARDGLSEGLHRVGVLLAEGLPNLFANAAASLVLAATLAAFAPSRVTLVVLAAIGLAAATLYASRGWVERAQSEAWGAWGSMVERVGDVCDGRLDLVASGRSEDYIQRFAVTSREWEKRARRAARVVGVLGRIPVAGVALAVGAAVILDARASGASWEAAILRAGILAAGTPALVGVGLGLQSVASSARRLDLVAKICLRSNAKPSGRAAIPKIENVEWKNLTFAYEGSADPTLRDVSFQWHRGELLTLAGANGSGKSTCLRVALGLGKPTSGSVLVNDAQLDSLEIDAWRRTIAFLPQRPFLPPRATIDECLRFFDPDIDASAIEAALDRVGLLEGLRRASNDPLHVRVGALSVGEKQRVALARILCSKAPIVMLDEPDADLDRDGVWIVRDVVVELARERMVIVVAHGSLLLAVADRVVTLEAGRVVSDEVRKRSTERDVVSS